jgi:heme oxygenase (biliverdin-IX-beta and delta-forming)
MSSDHRRPAAREVDLGPAVRAPSHAERCRTLASQSLSATLSTVAREPPGFPYGSLVAVAVDDVGRPLFLLSDLAEHTGNLHADSRASALLTEPLGAHDQPLALGRVTILGPCAKVAPAQCAGVREAFLRQQPTAAYYVDFDDFGFYRIEPTALRYVGGFGRMSWVTADAYRAAEPDPLAALASGIVKQMNEEHAVDLLACTRALGGVADATRVTMTAVDRYGFEIAAATPAGPRAMRIAFDVAVTTADDVRRSIVIVTRRAGAPSSA